MKLSVFVCLMVVLFIQPTVVQGQGSSGERTFALVPTRGVFSTDGEALGLKIDKIKWQWKIYNFAGAVGFDQSINIWAGNLLYDAQNKAYHLDEVGGIIQNAAAIEIEAEMRINVSGGGNLTVKQRFDPVPLDGTSNYSNRDNTELSKNDFKEPMSDAEYEKLRQLIQKNMDKISFGIVNVTKIEFHGNYDKAIQDFKARGGSAQTAETQPNSSRNNNQMTINPGWDARAERERVEQLRQQRKQDWVQQQQAFKEKQEQTRKAEQQKAMQNWQNIIKQQQEVQRQKQIEVAERNRRSYEALQRNKEEAREAGNRLAEQQRQAQALQATKVQAAEELGTAIGTMLGRLHLEHIKNQEEKEERERQQEIERQQREAERKIREAEEQARKEREEQERYDNYKKQKFDSLHSEMQNRYNFQSPQLSELYEKSLDAVAQADQYDARWNMHQLLEEMPDKNTPVAGELSYWTARVYAIPYKEISEDEYVLAEGLAENARENLAGTEWDAAVNGLLYHLQVKESQLADQRMASLLSEGKNEEVVDLASRIIGHAEEYDLKDKNSEDLLYKATAAYNRRGIALSNLNRPNEAMVDFSKVKELISGDYGENELPEAERDDYYFHQGFYYFGQGDLKSALVNMNKAIQYELFTNDQQRMAYHVMRGMIYQAIDKITNVYDYNWILETITPKEDWDIRDLEPQKQNIIVNANINSGLEYASGYQYTSSNEWKGSAKDCLNDARDYLEKLDRPKRQIPLVNGYLMIEDYDKAREHADKKGFMGIEFNQQADGGITVNNVVPNGPAYFAGILPGDILIKIDGHDLSALPKEQLMVLISSFIPGSVIELIVARGDVQYTIHFEMGLDKKYPDELRTVPIIDSLKIKAEQLAAEQEEARKASVVAQRPDFPWILPEGWDPFDIESTPFRNEWDGKKYLEHLENSFSGDYPTEEDMEYYNELGHISLATSVYNPPALKNNSGYLSLYKDKIVFKWDKSPKQDKSVTASNIAGFGKDYEFNTWAGIITGFLFYYPEKNWNGNNEQKGFGVTVNDKQMGIIKYWMNRHWPWATYSGETVGYALINDPVNYPPREVSESLNFESEKTGPAKERTTLLQQPGFKREQQSLILKQDIAEIDKARIASFEIEQEQQHVTEESTSSGTAQQIVPPKSPEISQNTDKPWIMPEGWDICDIESTPFRKEIDGKEFVKRVDKYFDQNYDGNWQGPDNLDYYYDLGRLSFFGKVLMFGEGFFILDKNGLKYLWDKGDKNDFYMYAQNITEYDSDPMGKGQRLKYKIEEDRDVEYFLKLDEWENKVMCQWISKYWPWVTIKE